MRNISGTNPGPGRAPTSSTDALAPYELDALKVIGGVVRRAARTKSRDVTAVDLHAAQDILDRLHGSQTQPTESAEFNILVSPDWIRMKTIMLNALRPFPEARLALAEALAEIAG